MELEEIQTEWAKDGPIIPTLDNISNQSLRTYELHHKYWKMLTAERHFLRKVEFIFKNTQVLLDEHFSGALTKAEMEQAGLEPCPRKPKTALDKRNMIETHDLYIKWALVVGAQQDKIDFLQDIIKSIHNRGFAIKNWIEVEKFKNGGH